MGAIIEAVYGCRAKRWPVRESSIALAARAARESLRRARREAKELEVLINTGIFRDKNISEPAIASFIQRSIGANPSCGEPFGPSTLSFDLANGCCGFLNGIEIVSGFLHSGRAGCGMVVTSDVDPTPRASRGLSFAPTGAALVLAPGGPDRGFAQFHHESFPKHSHLLRSRILWIGDEVSGWSRSKHAVVSDESESFLGACVDSVDRAMERYLGRLGMELADVDLVIPSQFPADFPCALRERTGAGGRVVDATEEFGAAYTAGLPAALHASVVSGSWERIETALFVAVGAGIHVLLALYRREPAAEKLRV
jgi:3-oxoacyl-[acyl-carrier-protein] synthase-3